MSLSKHSTGASGQSGPCAVIVMATLECYELLASLRYNHSAGLTRVSHDSPNMNGGSDERPVYLLNRFEVPPAFTVGDSMLYGFPLPTPGTGERFNKLFAKNVHRLWRLFKPGCGLR